MQPKTNDCIVLTQYFWEKHNLERQSAIECTNMKHHISFHIPKTYLKRYMTDNK